MTLDDWQERLRSAVDRVGDFARRQVRRARLRRRKAPRIGLALGGGFARGLAHIGVLKVLEENQIAVHCLAGTSVGSIIAGAYASGASVEEIAAVARKVRWKDFASWTLSTMGLASNKRMEAFLKRTFRSLRFEDMKRPLAVVATDLRTGQAVVFTSGELVPAVRASCAYPGLFLPVAYQGAWLTDGGLVAAVPTRAARELGGDIVIGVTLESIDPNIEPQNVMDVLSRSLSIAQRTAEPVWRAYADAVVSPQVNGYRWDEFERADELMAAGEEAMRKALPDLKRWLEPGRRAQAVAR